MGNYPRKTSKNDTKLRKNLTNCKISKTGNAGAEFAKIDNARPFNWAESVILCLSEVRNFSQPLQSKAIKNAASVAPLKFQIKNENLIYL